MKIALTIIMCSSLANTCIQPYTFDKIYNNYYDCLMDGYEKSMTKLQDIGEKEVNDLEIYFKFGCSEIILPKAKPKIET